MKYSISTGALIMKEGHILLVHHYKEGKFDFWVPPGGRLEGAESLVDCARREVREETGLLVEPKHILYVEEFNGLEYHLIKLFFRCELIGGELTTNYQNVDEGFLIEARFFEQEELQNMNVYPAIIKDGFWQDVQSAAPTTKYLGLQIIQE